MSLPNVLLITVDSLRFDIINNTTPNPTTPTINCLFDEGLHFTRAYANGPYTRASFPSILTGTFPWSYDGFQQLSANRPHIAGLLRKEGYNTGGFHSNPYLGAEFGYDRGFETFVEGAESPTPLASLRRSIVRRLPREKVLYKGLRWLYKTFENLLGTDIGTPYVPGLRKTDIVTNWLDPESEPFFCWVHYMDPHHPYVPHEGTISEGMDRAQAIRLRQKMIESPDALTSNDLDTLRTLYRGEVEYVDLCISELLSYVGTISGDTVTIFLADHGEAFGEHGRYGHTDILYDEVTRIPMAVVTPDIDSGQSSKPVSCIDIVPTILNAINVEPPAACVGTPLQSFDNDEEQDRVVFTHAKEQSEPDASVMVCDGEWKLLADSAGAPEELYDLAADSEETNNLVETELETRDKLERKLSKHLKAIDGQSTQPDSSIEISDYTQNRLEQLGYIE